jgi:hypothetical protein
LTEYNKGNKTSKFYKLAENLQSIDFGKYPSTQIVTKADNTQFVATLPGWKGTAKGEHFTDEKDFASKILNASHGLATAYLGGKKTRKHKKSKTHKRGRKHHKTRKH